MVPSNHDVSFVVAQLSLFFSCHWGHLAGRQCLQLQYIAFMYLFTVLWCSTKPCKINLMVHYVLCLLCTEAEILNGHSS